MLICRWLAKVHVLSNYATGFSRVVVMVFICLLVPSGMIVCMKIWRRFSKKDKLDEEEAIESQSRVDFISRTGSFFGLSQEQVD